MFLILVNDVFFTSPMALTVPVLLIVGCYKFAETSTNRRTSSRVAGAAHGLAQPAVMLIVMDWYAVHAFDPDLSIWTEYALYLKLFVLGGITGGFLMGLYLMLSLALLKTHETEAFSSMRLQNYKNFLRMHLTLHKLTIYPIGIPEVPTRWKMNRNQNESTPDTYWWLPKAASPWWKPKKKGRTISLELIEDPIEIHF